MCPGVNLCFLFLKAYPFVPAAKHFSMYGLSVDAAAPSLHPRCVSGVRMVITLQCTVHIAQGVSQRMHVVVMHTVPCH